MKIVKQRIDIINPPSPEVLLRTLNRAARKCYQSEPKGQPDDKLINTIIKSGHTSVLEHEKFTLDIITDRGVLAELTRHRMAGFSVESTRYCKYNGGMEFIEPITLKDNKKLYDIWKRACEDSEKQYKEMMENGALAQEARQVLNNSLRVSMRVTFNIRSLRNMLYLRADNPAHPHIKEIMIPLLMYLQEKYPVILDNLRLENDNADGMIKHPERYQQDWDEEFRKKHGIEWKDYIFEKNEYTDNNLDVSELGNLKRIILEEN